MIFDTKLSCTWDVVNLSSIPKLTSAQNPLHGASLTHTAGRMIFNFSFAINPCLGITVSTVQSWNEIEHYRVRLAQRAKLIACFMSHKFDKVSKTSSQQNSSSFHEKKLETGLFRSYWTWWANKVMWKTSVLFAKQLKLKGLAMYIVYLCNDINFANWFYVCLVFHCY